MNQRLLVAAQVFSTPVRWAGTLVSLLVPVIIGLLFVQWPLRVLVGDGHILVNDMGQLAHAAVFMVGLGYAMASNGHIRLDIISFRFGVRLRATIELLGSVVIVIPWSVWLFWQSWPFMRMSFLQGERFPETLSPGYAGFKILLVVAPVLAACMGLSWACQALAILLPASRNERT